MVETAFNPHDPRKIQDKLAVERCVEVLAELKPKFIHHPKSKEFIQGMLAERGCDLSKTYVDVPRLRTAFPSDYLSSGIAYAFHPHRDTWYSAPMCQINWWLPVFRLSPDNAMAFHPAYWANGLRNSSSGYNYQRWNKEARFNAANQIGTDTRPQPQALEPVQMEGDLRLAPPPGGIIVFSGAQLHSSVRNMSGRTRFSIDFRTVNGEDAASLRGARNVDSECTGSTMHDYLRCTDLAHLPDATLELYEAGPPQAALLRA
jgi:hypothetical protein